MNDNYNPNENQNQNPNQSNPPNAGNMWNVPRQEEEQGYRPPYYADENHRNEPPIADEQPPQQHQYSASTGWQKPSAQTPAKQGGGYKFNFAEYEQAQTLHPKRKSKGLIVFSIILASVVVISLVSFAGVGIASMIGSGTSQSDGLQTTPREELPGMELQNKPAAPETVLPGGKLSTEQIVEKMEPSIVAITTYLEGQSYQAQGMGSGIVMREDGYVVTNAHVVKGARGITVTMSDGTTKYEGRVIGSDEQTDLAVIKIDAEGLTPAVFGNSKETKVGEKVLAIGNPQSLDFSGSVTQGIVSGLNRSLMAGDANGGTVTEYTSLIQTDAAINPGNSGGALVNEYGQVIGINSAKVVATGAEGMGFAIPSSEAKPIIDDLIEHGRVTGRVMLGITVVSIDQVAARLYNIPVGLQVQTTQKDSDISKKGVVPGDIITKVNGKDIETQSVLTAEMKGKKPGDSVELEVYRPAATMSQKGRFFNVTVKLMESTEDATASVQQPQEVLPSDDYNQNPETEPPAGDRRPSDQELEDFFNQFFG